MNSMTGYGYQEATEDGVFLSVEIKSYNSRYLDLAVNLPSSLSFGSGWVPPWCGARWRCMCDCGRRSLPPRCW